MDALDDVFRALADPTRRRLLDSLNDRAGQTLTDLCSGLAMARQSVSKHLAVLEDAKLVTTVWRGREKLHYLNAAPINDISDRWINRYHRGRVSALAALKKSLEETPMPKPEFVYVTYIRTTPERLWQALTDPEFTMQYWNRRFFTDWKKGSTYGLEQTGIRVEDPGQVILESDPPRRLAYTWHKVNDEMAEKFGWNPDFYARLKSESLSKVSFEIEPQDDGQVRLTVVHDGFEGDGSAVLESVSGGWPRVLSSLKTLLEAGQS